MGKPDIRQEWVLVTPDLAAEWLKNNPFNRKLRSATVEQYASDMRRGEWGISDTPIAMTKFGRLLNGQHRLHAVIKSGVSVYMLILYDCPECMVFDAGATRSIGDQLALRGTKVNARIISSARYALKSVAHIIKPSVSQTQAYIDRRISELQTADRVCCISFKKVRVLGKAPIMLAFTAALIYGIPAENLERFSNVANSGFYDGEEETPAIVIRNEILGSENVTVWSHMEEKTEKAILDFYAGIPRRRRYEVGDNAIKRAFIEADGDFIKSLR